MSLRSPLAYGRRHPRDSCCRDLSSHDLRSSLPTSLLRHRSSWGISLGPHMQAVAWRCKQPGSSLCSHLSQQHPTYPDAMHPDAARRRVESEHRARTRQQERDSIATPWWRDERHVRLFSQPQQLLDLILEHEDSGRLVVVNFFSEHCLGCKALHPKLQSIAAANPEVAFCKVNGSDPAFAAFFIESGIRSVPWFHMYRNGQRVSSMSATLNPQRLAAFREQIEAHKGKDPRVLA